MKGNNRIGHIREGSKDKVYIVCIRENNNGSFDCIGRYGRRGENLREQIKARGVTRFAAETAADKLISSKFYRNRDAYEDIESPGYANGLTRHNPWLQNWLEEETKGTVIPKKKKKLPEINPIKKSSIKKSAPKRKEDLELVCINNAGYEDMFDFGVEYIVTKGRPTDDFITVLDKFNKQQEVFSERFATLKDATAKGLINQSVMA
jgi:hypothetical protein